MARPTEAIAERRTLNARQNGLFGTFPASTDNAKWSVG
jgi:hypothetical protein